MEASLQCPACHRLFKSMRGQRSHLRTARSCQWFQQGINPPELPPRSTSPPDAGNDGGEVFIQDDNAIAGYDEEFPGDVMQEMEDRDNTFDLLPRGIGEFQPEARPPNVNPSRHIPVRHLQAATDSHVELVHPTAGQVTYTTTTHYSKWRRYFRNGDEDVKMDGLDNTVNMFSPFKSRLDWEVAHWAVKDNPGHTSFDRLLKIPGVREKLGLSYQNIRGLHQLVDKIPERSRWKTFYLSFKDRPREKHRIIYRDPIEAIRSLWGNPTHANQFVYAPTTVFLSRKKDIRIYSEMWTGTWWENIQGRLPPTATVCPVIIATDKTHLTQFSGGKSAYPVYLTLGNLPKAIRRKPSEQACILVAYLSTEPIRRGRLTEQGQRARRQRVFHESMHVVLKPLKEAGNSGVDMADGDGNVRKVYPILASYVADYPEQCLVTCTKYGTCPKCQCSAQCLQEVEAAASRTHAWTCGIIADARKNASSSSQFHEYCMALDVSGSVSRPFWYSFPHTNMHNSITPDVLHQLYQGVFKHMLGWCQKFMGKDELDERIRTLPPTFGVKYFKNGISGLSQVSGSECKAMAKILLGCLVGYASDKALLACRGILDFIFLAQYASHDDITLGYMQEALNLFQANRDVFVTLKIRNDFNIPKFHSLLHYIKSIELFGTTDNYNSEMFERLHIDFAKEGWRASNRRDELPQMVRWLSRQEKTTAFKHYLDTLTPAATPNPVRNFAGQPIKVPKYPHSRGKAISAIQATHHCPGFSRDLKSYLDNLSVGPNRSARILKDTPLPFDKLDVYHAFKFVPTALDDHYEAEDDQTVKATPSLEDKPARFDTVIVLHDENAEATGLQGEPLFLHFDRTVLMHNAGTKVARLRVLFKLPEILHGRQTPESWPKNILAYVEWYTKPKGAGEPHHLMYSISRPRLRIDETASGSVLPIVNIRQTCQLIPVFGRLARVDPEWTSNNVLDMCSSFLINNWGGLYAYQTIW